MPYLEFLLSKNHLAYHYEKDSEKWFLAPDSQIRKNHRQFEVVVHSGIYDGFDLDSIVHIEPKSAESMASAEELARFALEASHGKIAESDIKGCIGTIALLHYPDIPETKPYFQIVILLPMDVFFRVYAYLETRSIYLTMESRLMGPGLEYGDDPNGKELKWSLEDANVVIAESVSLRFKPNPTVTDDPDSQEVIKPPDSQPSIPLPLDLTELSRGINRLFWAVVLIGGLLVLKAFM